VLQIEASLSEAMSQNKCALSFLC